MRGACLILPGRQANPAAARAGAILVIPLEGASSLERRKPALSRVVRFAPPVGVSESGWPAQEQPVFVLVLRRVAARVAMEE